MKSSSFSFPVSGSSKLLFFVVLFAAFLASGCGKGKNSAAASGSDPDSASSTAKDSAANDTSKAARDKKTATAVPVEVASVRRGEVYDYILQNSTVDTEEGVEVFSRLIGEIVRLEVEEGSRVAQGSVLCRLEDADYRLARDKAKVVYEKKQSDFKRFQDMHDKQLVSSEQFEDARFNQEQARIDFERAELDLQRTRITAPLGGVVTTRYVKLGERVTAANPLFKIVTLDEKIAVIHVPEREISRVRDDQNAYLSTENLPGRRFNSMVKRIAPAVDAASGTFKVTIEIRDPEERLRPGMFVAVHIITDTHPSALLIPKAAVVYENGLPHAFFVEQDTLARRISLEKGYSDEQYVEVLSSVRDSDKVIVVGQNGLKDGARIKVVAGLLDENGQISSRDTTAKMDTL